MMNVSELLVTLRQETALRVYIRRMELLEQTPNILKARLQNILTITLFLRLVLLIWKEDHWRHLFRYL